MDKCYHFVGYYQVGQVIYAGEQSHDGYWRIWRIDLTSDADVSVAYGSTSMPSRGNDWTTQDFGTVESKL